MATIGIFTKSGNDFTGTIKTVTVNVKARIVAVETPNPRGPDYRVILANAAELGAAWTKETKANGDEYLAVKLDDPTFPAPIYANLVHEKDEKWNLIWSRRAE